MKKSLILLLSLALVISLGACGKKQGEENKSTAGEADNPGGFRVGEPNTILGWLKSGQGVECAVDSTEAGRITVRAMGDKVKISGFPYVDMANPDPENMVDGHSLTADGWMYMWGGRSGMKMDMERMKELGEELSPEERQDQPKTWEDMAEEWEEKGFNYNCGAKRFGDGEFAPPAGVEFSDLTSFMEDMAGMSRQLQQQNQAGQEVDLDAIKRQAEEMKAQYGIE